MGSKEINELYKITNKKILRYFSKYKQTYDDDLISQFRNDVFMKLVENPNLKKISNLDSFIYSVCRNHKIDYERNCKQRKDLFKNIEDQDYRLEELNIEERLIMNDIRNDKYLKFDTQTKKIIDYKFEGYKHREICSLLNISKATLHRKLEIARQ